MVFEYFANEKISLVWGNTPIFISSIMHHLSLTLVGAGTVQPLVALASSPASTSNPTANQAPHNTVSSPPVTAPTPEEGSASADSQSNIDLLTDQYIAIIEEKAQQEINKIKEKIAIVKREAEKAGEALTSLGKE